MIIFSKFLSETDIKCRLSVPKPALKFLPSFREHSHAVNFMATDLNGNVWPLRCLIRKKNKYLKPVLSKGWRKFVRENQLKAGDIITFKKISGTARYRVKFERTIHNEEAPPSAAEVEGAELTLPHRNEAEIKLFGVIITTAPRP